MAIGADSPSAHSLCAPKPQRHPKPAPRKETEAEKRHGEKRFGKKRLLMGLRYSSYRVALTRQESGRHGTRCKYTGYKDTRDELLRDLCFYLYRRVLPALCLPTGEAAHSALPRAVPCPPPATEATWLCPCSCQRHPGLGTEGQEGGSGRCSGEVLGFYVTCRHLCGCQEVTRGCCGGIEGKGTPREGTASSSCPFCFAPRLRADPAPQSPVLRDGASPLHPGTRSTAVRGWAPSCDPPKPSPALSLEMGHGSDPSQGHCPAPNSRIGAGNRAGR